MNKPYYRNGFYYRDKYGKIWQKIGDSVWSQDTGWGGWWDGKGLTPVLEGSGKPPTHNKRGKTKQL